MKIFLKYFSFSIFLIAYFNLNAQPTYLKRLSFNSQPSSAYFQPQDSIMHLLQFSQSLTGHSYIEIRTDRYYTQIMKLDLSGNTIWESSGSWRGSHSNSWLRGLHATPDGGVIYIYNYIYYDYPQYSDSYLIKLDSSGASMWSVEVPPMLNIYGKQQESYDVAVLPNGYACLATDSLFLFDENGLVTGTFDFRGPGTLQGFSNGDIFFFGQSARARLDSSGIIRYSIPGLVFNYDTLLYATTADSIHLLDGMTGTYISSIYLSPTGSNKILMMADGGWASYNRSRINRFDSTGNLLWIKDVPLPTFGMNLIGEQSDGSILTGGTYMSSGDYYRSSPFPIIDYSSFITTIDSSGNSIVDSFSQVTPGDANDDGRFDIGDALYIALAQGSIGPSRYDSIWNNRISGYFGGDIAQDFSGSFAIGVNHKQCDYEPDGVIDSLDLEHAAILGVLFGRGSNVPMRMRNPNQNNSIAALPYFSCLPDRDSALTGDVVRFHFIIGDNGVSVDSIFGLAFNLGWDSLSTWDMALGPWAYAMTSDLGAISDLRVLNPKVLGLRNTLLVARRDLQNSYMVQDTIGYMDLLILDSTSGNIELNINLLAFKAITAGGFPIEFQYNTKPVHLRSLINKTSETYLEKINLYPVPAKDVLIIDNLPPKDLSILVYNSEGKECYSVFTNSFSKLNINLEGYSKGLYLIQLLDKGRAVQTRKFVKE